MKELVKLVNDWADYHEINPKATREEFCRYILAKSERTPVRDAGVSPPDLDAHFMKVVMRFTQSYMLYARIALKDSKLPDHESFVLLAVLHSLGEAQKSDVITYAMIDISTGSDILARLRKAGYIAERVDPDDRRSKLISLTAKGRTVIRDGFKRTLIARKFFLKGLSHDDKQLCIQILEPLEKKHSRLSVESKNKTIEEISGNK